jgi:Flp pilus assembly secretin CpaC
MNEVMQMKTIYLAGAALLFSVSVMADVKETEEFTFEVNPGARISVENVNGDIRVTGGSGDTVHVMAYKKAGSQEYMDKLKVIVDASADHVRIETDHPDSKGGWFNWGNDNSGSVAYELTVPADADLDSIDTVNGDVTIESVDGEVQAGTVNGTVEVSGVRADVSLETVNGSITAVFEELGAGQRVNADTVNGKITIYLPAEASARVVAETVNGSIDGDDFGLEVEKGFVGRDLDGKIGGGDARVSLDTVNGSIRIKKN